MSLNLSFARILIPMLVVLTSIISLSVSAGTTFTYRTRNTTSFSVVAPGLLANDLGLGVTPLAVKQLNGSNTLTGTSVQGAAVTLNADGSFTYNPSGAAALQALTPGQTVTDSFTYTLSVPGTTLGGTGMAFTNVPEAATYALVYQLAIPDMAAFNGATVPYTTNNAAAITYPIRRIAYYMELKTPTGTLEYAFASMDPFTTDATKMGVPTTQSAALFQTKVNNLTVISNSANVTQGTNLTTGNIEFWPSNYGTGLTLNLPNGDAANYDYDDNGGGTGAGYGSMQIHDHGARRTIFAYNRWGSGNGGSNSDLGIGNSPTGTHTDWTFRSNANAYSVKNLQVLVQPPVATATVTIQVSNYGVSIASVTLNEGNTGTTNFPFVATLSQVSNDPVTVQYATANGTAVAPGDFTATSGMVTIPAGQLTAPIPVSVNGDTSFETNEAFTVVLSSPTNANLITGASTATGTITNDDAVPAITLGDFALAEGNTGTTTFAVPITLSNTSYQAITVQVDTANGTATAAADYVAVVAGSATVPADTLSTVVNITVNGEIVIEPNETFTVTLSNASSGTFAKAAATVTITNDDFAPVAVDDLCPSRFDQPMVVPARGVLTNDTDPDAPSTALIAILVSPPATGTFALQADGSFTYTPVVFAVGTTTFTYRVQDATGLQSNVATVTISLQPNAAPVTTPGSVTVAEDTPQTFNFPVTDSTNDSLSIIITRPPTFGTLAVVSNVSVPRFTYIPLLNVNGADSFSFSASDGVFTATGDVAVTITPVNDAPTATSNNYEAGLNSFADATLVGGDAADGTGVTFSIVTPPTNGSVTITNAATGAFRYTPALNFLGFDSFTFRTSDGTLNSATATATIEVKPAPIFTSNPTVAPNPLLALQTLTGTSAANNGAISWSWGDGTTSDGGNATHVYAATGVYTVVTTITATTGLKTTATQLVYVGAPLNGGAGGANPSGIVITGSGTGSSGAGKGKILCNYVKREKSYYSGSLKGLAIPSTLKQEDLLSKNGILTLGAGSVATPFSVPFVLDAKGKAKSTGLPLMRIDLKKGSFSFKAQSSALTDLTEALGGTRQFTKSSTPQILNVPVTIQVGTNIFFVLTFQMKYSQSGGGIGKGGV